RPMQVEPAPVVALRLRVGSSRDRQLTPIFVDLRQTALMREGLVDSLRAPGVFERLAESPLARRDVGQLQVPRRDLGLIPHRARDLEPQEEGLTRASAMAQRSLGDPEIQI